MTSSQTTESNKDQQKSGSMYNCFQSSLLWELGLVSNFRNGNITQRYELALDDEPVRVQLALHASKDGPIGFYLKNLSGSELHMQYGLSMVTGTGNRVCYRKPVWRVYEASGCAHDTRGHKEVCQWAAVKKLPSPGTTDLTLYCDLKILRERGERGRRELADCAAVQEDSPSTLTRGLLDMLERRRYTDFELTSAEEGKAEFPCHKLILAACSEGLEEVVSAEEERRLELKCSPRVVEAFLHYVYSGRLGTADDHQTVMGLLQLGEQFGVSKLVALCSNRLAGMLNVANSASIARAAHVYGLSRLRCRATDFIVENAEQVCDTKGWDELGDNCPDVINGVLALLAAKVGDGYKTVASKMINEIPAGQQQQGAAPSAEHPTGVQLQVSPATTTTTVATIASDD